MKYPVDDEDLHSLGSLRWTFYWQKSQPRRQHELRALKDGWVKFIMRIDDELLMRLQYEGYLLANCRHDWMLRIKGLIADYDSDEAKGIQ